MQKLESRKKPNFRKGKKPNFRKAQMIPENPKTLKAETLANSESKSPEVKENTGAQTRHTPTVRRGEVQICHPPILPTPLARLLSLVTTRK